MASKTDIINLAATYISEARSIDPETDTGETPRTLNFLYDFTRKKVLRAHKWGSAKEDVQISADATAPIFKWARAFTLPVDFVRMVSIQEVDVDAINPPRYEIKGRKILTNEAAPLNVTYIKDLEAVGDMDDMLIDSIALRLAADAVMKTTDSIPMADFLEGKYVAMVEEAKFTDSMEQRRPLEDRYSQSSWDHAHFGGGFIQ
jgi:hypothetical protein